VTLLTLALPAAATRSGPANGTGEERCAPPWLGVCELEEIVPGTGVCALVAGEQVAIVRVGPGEQLYALGNFDPFSRAFVLARGIVGDKDGVPKIASPLYKQSFDLRTGICLDDPKVAVPVWSVRVREGRVEVQLHPDFITPPGPA
jgi:nitrite reductase (NADH) small subunit